MKSLESALPDKNEVVIESTELFKGLKSVLIVHGNEIYILRITKGNKLILMK